MLSRIFMPYSAVLCRETTLYPIHHDLLISLAPQFKYRVNFILLCRKALTESGLCVLTARRAVAVVAAEADCRRQFTAMTIRMDVAHSLLICDLATITWSLL